jgi:Ca2+-binding RTX toxin-like protein
MRKIVLLLASMALAVVLTSGVAWALNYVQCTGGACAGTEVEDSIQGSDVNDQISALGGADWVEGGLGGDVVRGGLGDDIISGDNGPDKLYGDANKDELYGNAGQDKLYGGGGADYIESAADGKVDYVDCGSGIDFTQHSNNDVLVNCEDGLGNIR